MKNVKILMIIAVAATLSACGDFEWFPAVADTTPPTITASIAGATIFANRTTHVPAASFPASVVFSSTEAATIYYTTSGSDPTTASPSLVISSSGGISGPTISVTNTILKFFGIDKRSNASAIQTGTIKSP